MNADDVIDEEEPDLLVSRAAMNGWAWVLGSTLLDDLLRPGFEHHWNLGQNWNGEFTAPCPCGRVVTWNAYGGKEPWPICQC